MYLGIRGKLLRYKIIDFLETEDDQEDAATCV